MTHKVPLWRLCVLCSVSQRGLSPQQSWRSLLPFCLYCPRLHCERWNVLQFSFTQAVLFTNQAETSAAGFNRIHRMHQIALEIHKCVSLWLNLPDLLFLTAQHQFSALQVWRYLHIKNTNHYRRLNGFAVRSQRAINMWIDAGAFFKQEGVKIESVAGGL